MLYLHCPVVIQATTQNRLQMTKFMFWFVCFLLTQQKLRSQFCRRWQTSERQPVTWVRLWLYEYNICSTGGWEILSNLLSQQVAQLVQQASHVQRPGPGCSGPGSSRTCSPCCMSSHLSSSCVLSVSDLMLSCPWFGNWIKKMSSVDWMCFCLKGFPKLR